MKANLDSSAMMTPKTDHQSAIILTERGLTIVATRITLYDVMDYLLAEYPSKFIQGLFELTENQIDAALTYIEVNRVEVVAKYKQVIQETKGLQKYYAGRNRERIARIAVHPPKPGTEAAWEKLRAAKAKRQSAA